MRKIALIVSVLATVIVGCAGASSGSDEATADDELGLDCGSSVSLAPRQPLEAGDELVIETQPERAGQFYFKSLRLGQNANAFSALRHAKGTRNLGETVEGTYSIIPPSLIRPRCATSDRNLELTIGGEKTAFAVLTQANGSFLFAAPTEGDSYGSFAMKPGVASTTTGAGAVIDAGTN